ncbi:MAG TPA: MFS transporter [Nocardioidaceae bacterium]|nr:MFS transporter [Nocardioidaceae bacterium]
MLALLRRRDFALLWTGGLVSVAGDYVLHAALPFFVYAQTESTVATAGMIAAQLAPDVVLGTVAGVFVDRWDRTRVLVISNLLQAAAVALLLLVPLDGWLWVVFVVAAVQSAVAAFAVPAEGALLPSLVDNADLVAANALNALNNRLARLIGVPVGGVLLAAFGLHEVVLVDCATFVVAAVLIAPLGARPARRDGADQVVLGAADETAGEQARTAWARFWSEWVGGMRLIRGDRILFTIFAVLGLMTFGGTMLDPLTVAWVRDELLAGPEIYALLMSVHAASGIVGTLVVGHFGATLSPRHLIGWASLVAGLTNLISYNVPLITLAVAVAASTGVSSVFSSVGVETMVQRGVADAYRGRVYGALGASGSLLSLLGAATAGIFAEVVGVVVMLSVAAGLIMLAGVVVLWAFAGERALPAANRGTGDRPQATASEASTDVKNANPSVPGPHSDSTACSG